MNELERSGPRAAIEVKAGRGAGGHALLTLQESLEDIGVDRAWLVDQSPGIELLEPRIARRRFTPPTC